MNEWVNVCSYLTITVWHRHRTNRAVYKCLWRQFKARKDGFVRYISFFSIYFSYARPISCLAIARVMNVSVCVNCCFFSPCSSPLLVQWSHVPKWFPNKIHRLVGDIQLTAIIMTLFLLSLIYKWSRMKWNAIRLSCFATFASIQSTDAKWMEPL